MNDREIRKKILQALYDEDRKDPGAGSLDMHTIPHEFQVDEKFSEFNVYFLEENGFIAFTGGGGVIGITAKGKNFVEGPNEFNPVPQFIQQTIEIHGGQIGQINQGHVINNPSLFLSELADQIERRPDIDPEKKAFWKRALFEMSKHPFLLEAIRILFPDSST